MFSSIHIIPILSFHHSITSHLSIASIASIHRIYRIHPIASMHSIVRPPAAGWRPPRLAAAGDEATPGLMAKLDETLAQYDIDSTACMQRGVCTYVRRAALSVREGHPESNDLLLEGLVRSVTTQRHRCHTQCHQCQPTVTRGRSMETNHIMWCEERHGAYCLVVKVNLVRPNVDALWQKQHIHTGTLVGALVVLLTAARLVTITNFLNLWT